jgi:hypothetical protein
VVRATLCPIPISVWKIINANISGGFFRNKSASVQQGRIESWRASSRYIQETTICFEFQNLLGGFYTHRQTIFSNSKSAWLKHLAAHVSKLSLNALEKISSQ